MFHFPIPPYTAEYEGKSIIHFLKIKSRDECVEMGNLLRTIFISRINAHIIVPLFQLHTRAESWGEYTAIPSSLWISRAVPPLRRRFVNAEWAREGMANKKFFIHIYRSNWNPSKSYNFVIKFCCFAHFISTSIQLFSYLPFLLHKCNMYVLAIFAINWRKHFSRFAPQQLSAEQTRFAVNWQIYI